MHSSSLPNLPVLLVGNTDKDAIVISNAANVTAEEFTRHDKLEISIVKLEILLGAFSGSTRGLLGV
jgi:hypothetical protein